MGFQEEGDSCVSEALDSDSSFKQALEIPDVSGSTGSSPLLSEGDALMAASTLPCVVINDPS